MKKTEIEAILYLALTIAATTLFFWYCQSSIVEVEAKVLSSSCITSISTSTFVRGVRTSERTNYYSYVEVEFPDGTKSTLSSIDGSYGGRLKVGDRIKVGRFGERRGTGYFLFDDDFNKELLSKREANCQSE